MITMIIKMMRMMRKMISDDDDGSEDNCRDGDGSDNDQLQGWMMTIIKMMMMVTILMMMMITVMTMMTLPSCKFGQPGCSDFGLPIVQCR